MSIYVNYVKIFLPKFFAEYFDEWGKEAPNYEADFEKGIPAQEYGALSEKLALMKRFWDYWILQHKHDMSLKGHLMWI